MSTFLTKFRPLTLPLLRWAFALIYFWFGLLKIFNRSPVESLLERTFLGWDPQLIVLLIGVMEVMIGVGFLIPKLTAYIFPLFFLQMLGTFFPMIIRPDLTFNEGNILLLTKEGEFIVKNFILIAAGLVLLCYGHIVKRKA